MEAAVRCISWTHPRSQAPRGAILIPLHLFRVPSTPTCTRRPPGPRPRRATRRLASRRMDRSDLKAQEAFLSYQSKDASHQKNVLDKANCADLCRSLTIQNFGDNTSDIPNSIHRSDSSNVLHSPPNGTYYQTRLSTHTHMSLAH